MDIIVKSIIIFELRKEILAEYLDVLGRQALFLALQLLVPEAAEFRVIIDLDASVLIGPLEILLGVFPFEHFLQIQNILVELSHLNLSVVLETVDVLNKEICYLNVIGIGCTTDVAVVVVGSWDWKELKIRKQVPDQWRHPRINGFFSSGPSSKDFYFPKNVAELIKLYSLTFQDEPRSRIVLIGIESRES